MKPIFVAPLVSCLFFATHPSSAADSLSSESTLTNRIDALLLRTESDATSASLAVRLHAMTEASNEECAIIRSALWRAGAPANSPAAEALRLVRGLYATCEGIAAAGTLGTGSVPLSSAPGFAVGAGGVPAGAPGLVVGAATSNYQ